MIYRFPKSLACTAAIATMMIATIAMAASPFRVHKGKGIGTQTSFVVDNGIATGTSTTIGTGTHFGKYVLKGTFKTVLATGQGTGVFEQTAADGSIARGTVQFQILPNGVGIGQWQFTGAGTKRFANVKGAGDYRVVPINALQSDFSWTGAIAY